MNHGLLDINDCELQLWHGDRHIESPGYALLSGNRYEFGNAAVRAARLRPRDVNTRYWWQLNTEALQPRLGPARHTGDLVHAHLQALYHEAGRPAELVLAVPGSMQRAQLSLLLGIINECPFNAVGLVHRSALLASLSPPSERLWHLELQLHQALLSEVVADGSHVRIEHSLPLPGFGLLSLQEALASKAAAAFVRQTRFDPRHQAATEQVLYDALPALLAELATAGEANVDVGGYLARVGRRELEHITEALCRRVAEQVAGAPVIADARVALLPGVAGALPDLQFLAAEDPLQAAAAHGESLVQRRGHLDFITRLPGLGAKERQATGPAAAAVAAIPAATHLLEGGIARPLNGAGVALAAGWTLEHVGGAWRLRGGAGNVRVNQADYEPGRQLAAGDTIHIDGASPMTLIAVQD